MNIINLNDARRLHCLRPLSPLEYRVLRRWFNRMPFARVVRLRDQRGGGDFYLVKGGKA